MLDIDSGFYLRLAATIIFIVLNKRCVWYVRASHVIRARALMMRVK